MVIFLFWKLTKTNYVSKWSNFQEKLIEIFTTSIFYLKLKELKQWKWHGGTCFLGCFLFHPTAKPNRPNSLKQRRCCSFLYIFLVICNGNCKSVCEALYGRWTEKKKNLDCFYSISANRREQKGWFLWKNMHQSMSRNWKNSSSMLQSLNFFYVFLWFWT